MAQWQETGSRILLDFFLLVAGLPAGCRLASLTSRLPPGPRTTVWVEEGLCHL